MFPIYPWPAGWKFLSFQPAQSCWQQRRWLALRRSSWPPPAPLRPPSPNFESLKLTGLERWSLFIYKHYFLFCSYLSILHSWPIFHRNTNGRNKLAPRGVQKGSADVLSGRHFVRTALDVLSGRRFVRTSLDVLSGRRFVRTDLCDIFFRWTGLDVLSGRRFVRTVLRVVISWAYLEHIFGISRAYLGHISGISRAYLGHILGISWAYLGHISCISWAYLGYISGIS